jgi:hypothetical protein
MAPQREAAMFYGLFLRGHPVEAIREEIDIPSTVIRKVLRSKKYEAELRESLRRSYEYRKQVLAIFDRLVTDERNRGRVNLQ